MEGENEGRSADRGDAALCHRDRAPASPIARGSTYTWPGREGGGPSLRGELRGEPSSGARGDRDRATCLVHGRLDAGAGSPQPAQAYCWGFIANARRAVGDLDGAEAAFAEVWRRWQPEQPAHLEPLPEWRLHNLEASLRRDQRHYYDALECLDKATAFVNLDQDVYRMLLGRKKRLTEILITLTGDNTAPPDDGSADEM